MNINPGEAPLPKEGGQRAGGLGVIAVRKLPLLAPWSPAPSAQPSLELAPPRDSGTVVLAPRPLTEETELLRAARGSGSQLPGWGC